MADIKKLLELRKAQKAKKPHFKRQDWHKKARLDPVWRKPKGMDSKLRRHMHAHGHLPTTGYRGPLLVRGMHKSGLVPVLVHTVSQLEHISGKTHGIIIAATVGNRRRVELITKAQSKTIRVLNIKDASKFAQDVKADLAARKHAKTAHKQPEKVATKPSKPEASSTQEEKKEQEKREAEKVLTGKQ